MSDDFDKRVLNEIDRVLELIRADAERRGIDTRGKSMEEIQKLLADRGERGAKSTDLNKLAAGIVETATKDK